jgi:hypothetical protein
VEFITDIQDFDEIEKHSTSFCYQVPILNKISVEITINIPIVE